MSISCTCGDGDYEWWCEPADNYQYLDTLRRKRCDSCHKLINHGTHCLKFFKWRSPRSDIEERIHGEEVYLAPFYFCEECADLYFSIIELGYCISMDGTPMRKEAEMVAEIERSKREYKNERTN